MSFFNDIFGSGGSDAAEEAQEAYAAQIQKAIEEYQESLKQGRADIGQGYRRAMGFEQPYLGAGKEALGAYMGTLGLGGGGERQAAINRFKASPGYQFALQQGLQGTQRGMAAHGLAGSGAEQKALTQYGQGLANQEYGQYQQRLGGLTSMGAGMGQTAAGQALGTGKSLAGLGQQYAQMIGQAYGGLGAGQASSIMAGYGADAAQNAAFMNMLGGIGGGLLGGMGGFGGFGGGGGSSPWLNPDTHRFM